MSDKRQSLRELVAARANHCCEYCYSQERYATESFSLEHVAPKSKGGKTASENLAYSCQGCNNHKYNKTHGLDPLTEESVTLFNPRTQHWSEHFVWSPDYTTILGITPSGRATVATLHLNRERLVNLRKVLYAVGEHPPK